MESIFTYEFETPRVSSPWLVNQRSSDRGTPQQRAASLQSSTLEHAFEDWSGLLNDEQQVTRLDAEPQEGPTEYKLHLLLRPRRALLWSSTGNYITGSQHSKSPSLGPQSLLDGDVAVVSGANSSGNVPSGTSISSTSRNHRLIQLTTQLVWRLQQSSPVHLASTNDFVPPELPEASVELQRPQRIAKLLPGLEESKGALYEIGVSDDGSLIGLTTEEMNESLNNLRAMAASLGCSVDILRMIPVGECRWVDEGTIIEAGVQVSTRKDRLFVAEAYIKPELGEEFSQRDGPDDKNVENRDSSAHHQDRPNASKERAKKLGNTSTVREQLRVSLTGSTTSGKSSLLGTLSTSTLDNGRGKSRLSLLKHRHEIVSGVTSSVAQELIGYCDVTEANHQNQPRIVNYAAPNVASWNDIHTSISSGRLVFVSDSAGHPRYRRTTVRGLLSWAPHWTLVCIAANGGSGSSLAVDKGSEFSDASTSISMAHLDLCLRLSLPLIIVVTKLDIASKSSFRQMLSAVLTSLKQAGRRPIMLSNDNTGQLDADVQEIHDKDSAEALRVVKEIGSEPSRAVPVVFTSSVKGTGISKLHCLLRHLPMPNNANARQPIRSDHRVIFHIDDNYMLPVANTIETATGDIERQCVVVGHLAAGTISVGELVRLGPFSSVSAVESGDQEAVPPSNAGDPFLTPRSFTDALARATSASGYPKEQLQEWRAVRVVSIRNLKMPVVSLETDHVGTIAIEPVDAPDQASKINVRRGMVLVSGDPSAMQSFTASFNIDDASSFVVGTRVVLYSGSVRASAKVIAIQLRAHEGSREYDPSSNDEDTLQFELEEMDDGQQRGAVEEFEAIHVTFQFSTYKEWIDVGARILVMPGGGPGLQSTNARGVKGIAGLEGFVGEVVESYT